jgi:hypothetical protein
MEARVHKKRFTPVPSDATVEDSPALRLLLTGLAKYRFLDSSHIKRLTGWGEDYGTRRLRELFDAGFITKPPKQVRMFGMRCDIYTLDRAGILFLKTFASWDKLYLSRAHKASSLPHKVTHGGNMAGIERSCMDSAGQVRLIDTWEILENAPHFKGIVGWDVDVHWKGETFTIRIIPDTLGGFRFMNAPEGKNKVYFVVETDLGTENAVRTNWHGTQTSILRKLIPYLETREQGILHQLFGIKKFKVLTIVNDEARIEEIIRKCTAVEPRLKNPMFLFATHEAVQKGDVLHIPWTTMSGQKGPLMTDSKQKESHTTSTGESVNSDTMSESHSESDGSTVVEDDDIS